MSFLDDFNNKDLLKVALTHSSFARHSKQPGVEDNERLEFLGDAVLKLIVSQYLFDRFGDYDEGRLTKLRAQIVSDKTLAGFAQSLNLGERILFSFGEKNSGGPARISNLANAFEAILGAIYLDKGLQEATDFLVPYIEKFGEEWVDAKSELQELSQKKKIDLPTYRVFKEEGPDHKKQFHIEASVMIEGRTVTAFGDGPSKKEAEQLAAAHLLKKIGE